MFGEGRYSGSINCVRDLEFKIDDSFWRVKREMGCQAPV